MLIESIIHNFKTSVEGHENEMKAPIDENGDEHKNKIGRSR